MDSLVEFKVFTDINPKGLSNQMYAFSRDHPGIEVVSIACSNETSRYSPEGRELPDNYLVILAYKKPKHPKIPV